MLNMQELIIGLNAPSKAQRLDALYNLKRMLDEGAIEKPVTGNDVNNHIHTTYSFSPYSPTKAVWMSYMAGLCTSGIVDHDSVSGAEEFIEAGEIMGFPTTVGFELRGTHTGTKLGNRRTNNPDQDGVSYLTFHGVPHNCLDDVKKLLKPINEARGKRNREMVDRILRTDLCTTAGITLDYDKDILPLSQCADGGSVTERHLLYALGLKLIEKLGKGESLVQCLKKAITISENVEKQLSDTKNAFYEYDLLGLLKAQLVSQFYVPAGIEDCPTIDALRQFADDHGIIVTYPYLGDIVSSVTGDKKAQTFEDSFLDELFEILSDLKFRAISYMPSRNTMEQLIRLRSLCQKYQMLQISGEDINSPRQSFICMAQRDPMFANLYDTTWALIGHEKTASIDKISGFTAMNKPLEEKIAYFKSKSGRA